MGFLDNILKKVGTALATRYGVIRSGKYADCSIALGNPPEKKITAANSWSQMIFIKDKEEVARLNIAGDILEIKYIETIKFPATGADGYRCEITFANGDTYEADLFPSKINIFYESTKWNMLEESCEFFEKEIERLFH